MQARQPIDSMTLFGYADSTPVTEVNDPIVKANVPLIKQMIKANGLKESDYMLGDQLIQSKIQNLQKSLSPTQWKDFESYLSGEQLVQLKFISLRQELITK